MGARSVVSQNKNKIILPLRKNAEVNKLVLEDLLAKLNKVKN